MGLLRLRRIYVALPITSQPDYAKIFINYIADKKMVESKSLKLYLFSFRNHGDFHEDCVQKICNDLSKLLRPRYIEVIGEFTPRGESPFARSPATITARNAS